MSYTYAARIIYTGNPNDILDVTGTEEYAGAAYAVGRKAIMARLRGRGVRMVKESGHDKGKTLTTGATRHAWDLYNRDGGEHIGYAWVDVSETPVLHDAHVRDAEIVFAAEAWAAAVVASPSYQAELTARREREAAEQASETPAVAVGDTVRASIFGKPTVARVAEVLADGRIRLARFGAIVSQWERVSADDAPADLADWERELLAEAPAAPVVADGPTLAELEAARERAAAELESAFAEFDAKHASEAADDVDYVERCHVCGEPNDYCQGHGETGDPRGWRIALAHDFGDHTECHAAGCEAAGTTEHADYPHEVGYLHDCAACETGGCVCCYSESLAPCVSNDCERREAADEPHGGDDEQAYPEWTERPAGPVVAVLVALAVWFLSGAFAGLVGSPTAYASPVPVVTEDSPEWNCATMGDHECGPRPAVAPVVPAHCLAVPGRQGNTRYVMVAPVPGLIVGCESGR